MSQGRRNPMVELCELAFLACFYVLVLKPELVADVRERARVVVERLKRRAGVWRTLTEIRQLPER